MESRVHIFTANAADPHGPVNAQTGVVSPEGQWLAHVPRQGEHRYSFDLTWDEE